MWQIYDVGSQYECSYITETLYEMVQNSNCTWICPKCDFFNFSDSFVDTQLNLEMTILTKEKKTRSSSNVTNKNNRYLDDLLNIDNPYCEGMVNRIYPPELQLNKANTSDTEAPFLDLHLSISNGFVSSKIYDKRYDFDLDIVNFPFLDGDVPRSTS